MSQEFNVNARIKELCEKRGFSYYELDRYLSGGLISAETTKQIEEMHIKSNHKRLGGRKYFRK